MHDEMVTVAGGHLVARLVDNNRIVIGHQNEWTFGKFKKKAGYSPALIAGEGFEPPTFGL